MWNPLLIQADRQVIHAAITLTNPWIQYLISIRIQNRVSFPIHGLTIQHITGTSDSIGPILFYITFSCIYLEQCTIMDDIVPCFGIQFFNPQLRVIVGILKIFLRKRHKVKICSTS